VYCARAGSATKQKRAAQRRLTMRRRLGNLGLWLTLPFLTMFPGKKAVASLPAGTAEPLVGKGPEVRNNTPLYLEHVRNVYGDGYKYPNRYSNVNGN
jgi:hypothetical protein